MLKFKPEGAQVRMNITDDPASSPLVKSSMAGESFIVIGPFEHGPPPELEQMIVTLLRGWNVEAV